MSWALPQSITLNTQDVTTDIMGNAEATLDTQTTVDGDIQPETSEIIKDGSIWMLVTKGKLFVSADTTIDPQAMTATDEFGQEWDIEGPVVQSAGADTKYVTVRRQVNQ